VSDAATIRERLSRFPAGMHRLAAPARLLDAGLPPGVPEVYRELDGGELFHESIILHPSREVGHEEEGFLQVGQVEGDELLVARETGEVWRLEEDTGERIQEGTRLDRWLHGAIAAEGTLYADDGEFREGVFDEDGELTAEAAARRERAALRRDRRAVGPRWRLARALSRLGKLEEARDELEEVVALAPAFPWALYDLARLSEQLGDLEAAQNDAEAAGEVDPTYEHAGLFWAHAARIAARRAHEPARAELAARALAAWPDLVRTQREGAVDRLEDGLIDEARELLDVALALAPRDLESLALRRRADAEAARTSSTEQDGGDDGGGGQDSG
jgi:tetratricopeptide (TPR) repeat protein